MNKKKILLISLILTIILSIILIYIERKIVNYKPMTTVVIALKTIEEGTELNENNVTSFIEMNVPIDLVTLGAVKSKDELNNKVALEKIYPNEIVNNNRIIDKNNAVKELLKDNEREFSIPVGLLDDPFVGTFRNKDKVDILFTNSATPNSPSQTKVLVKQARIIGALDSSGKFLLPTDKNILAAAIVFAGTMEDTAKVANSMYAGKFKIVRIPNGSNQSKDVIIQDGKVVQ